LKKENSKEIVIAGDFNSRREKNKYPGCGSIWRRSNK
jgi:hypothetical protein